MIPKCTYLVTISQLVKSWSKKLKFYGNHVPLYLLRNEIGLVYIFTKHNNDLNQIYTQNPMYLLEMIRKIPIC